MTYADEAFYKEKYLLGRKPAISAGFPFYARSASKIIDQYTFDRLNGTNPSEEVQMCCCELAESEYRKEKQQQEAGGKTSEKNGTYSVSFSAPQEVAESCRWEQRYIVMKWLGDTGLCYQGVD